MDSPKDTNSEDSRGEESIKSEENVSPDSSPINGYFSDSDNDENLAMEDIATKKEILKASPASLQPLKEIPKTKKKVIFKEELLERDAINLPVEDPKKKEKTELEEKLTTYFSNLTVTIDTPVAPVGIATSPPTVLKDQNEKGLPLRGETETKDISESDLADIKSQGEFETVEEALQRMQFEEKIKQLIAYLENVKFTITPQELSHLFKSYPSILLPEVAATFLSGLNTGAVSNMITHGFILDRRTEDLYVKIKEEVLYGIGDKEKKRLEVYYKPSDKWLEDNLK